MAKNTITQRIALEGGDAIKAQLRALGDAGEKAFKAIQEAAAKANFEKFTASLAKLGNQLATVTKRVALLGAGLTAAAAGSGAAIFSLARSAGEVADSAGKAAQMTGLQVEAYGRLNFAAEMANVSNDQFVAGMSRLNKAIADAAQQVTKAGAAIDASGVRVIRFGVAAKKTADATKATSSVFDQLGVKILTPMATCALTRRFCSTWPTPSRGCPIRPESRRLRSSFSARVERSCCRFSTRQRRGFSISAGRPSSWASS